MLFDTAPLYAVGSLTVSVRDEQTNQPLATRMELYRGAPTGPNPTSLAALGKPMSIRKTVPAGLGVVLDRSVEMSLPEGVYTFRIVRGPEYRIVSGTFTLERTSLDKRELALPRMVDMLDLGWTSGDCLVPASPADLPLRMAADDVHVACVLGQVESKPAPEKRKEEPLQFAPVWTSSNVQLHDGLAIYTAPSTDGADQAASGEPTPDTGMLPSERLASLGPDSHAAIENPFAWQVPVWLASNKIDGIFVLGDWLRLGSPTSKSNAGLNPNTGRAPSDLSLGNGQSLGRSAERIYWNVLEAGFKMPPLAGTGDEAPNTPVGYNRLYVAQPLSSGSTAATHQEATAVTSLDAWWQAVWAGHSIATNGPLLRPKLAGELPGHTFTANHGEVLELAVELTLSVRDPVDYLEVIHNGKVHYSARLEEFASAGGKIPSLQIDQSGWVVVRVVTLFEDHFRAAMSAPWYIEFDGQPRVTRQAVEFFQSWQTDYEQRLMKLPPAELARHVPLVQAARQFWAERAAIAK